MNDQNNGIGFGMKVTPWEVQGNIDYDKLINMFGTSVLDEELLNRIKKHTGELHFMLRRKIFFSHRDLNWLLDEYEKGNRFYLYTGRGPSGHTHLGHLQPWIFTKWLQDKFNVELYFQMTDDEKYLVKDGMSLGEANRFAYENMLDVIALGFKRGKTKIIVDSEHAGILYPLAIQVAKGITFSTAKAIFGFDNSTNIGLIFYTSMQAVPAFLKSVELGRNVPCLIPHGIDQDPHFRASRDVLPKLGYYKPASIHCKFFPGLNASGKMSASDPNSTIFTTDDEQTVKTKIFRAFSGGRDTVEEQKKLGGRPDICSVYNYYLFMFEPDDKKLLERRAACMSGAMTCAECKKELADRVNRFLKDHQKKREKARGLIKDYLYKPVYKTSYGRMISKIKGKNQG